MPETVKPTNRVTRPLTSAGVLLGSDHYDVRWWSGVPVGRPDEQGTPVRIRGGPAAVTERSKDSPFQFGHCRAAGAVRRPGKKSELGSQKTYQRENLRPLAWDSDREVVEKGIGD